MTLVEERNLWQSRFDKYEIDLVDTKTVLGAYRANRDNESWRASRQAEILCEYILWLESQIDWWDHML